MSQNVYDPNCAARLLLDNISKKWAALVIASLAEGPHRFGQLRGQVGGISQKVLTQILRSLERDGLVKREVNAATVPITVIYSLTPLGESLAEPIDAIRAWSEQHIEEVTLAQIVYDQTHRH